MIVFTTLWQTSFSYPDIFNRISEIAIPLYKPESEILPNDVVIKNMKYVNYISLIAVALLTGMKVISTTLASTASGPLSILLALVFFILR